MSYVVQVLFEGLCGFLVVFNNFNLFNINQEFFLWKIVRWGLLRVPIATLYVSSLVTSTPAQRDDAGASQASS